MTSLSEHVALVVNGEGVSLAEVLRLAKFSERLQLLGDAVDAALVRQAAARLGVAATGDELQQAADDFRAARELYDAEATEQWLAAHHLSYADWELMLEHEVVTRKLRERVTAARVEQHFAEHRLSFDAAAVSQIVAAGEDLARELRAQIVEDGADFHDLARRHSTNEATRPAGGYAGLVRRAGLEAAVEAAVFGAEPGKVVGPFKTDAGWCLFKVEALHPAKLDTAMRETVKSRLFAEWLEEQRRKAKLSAPLLTEPAGEENLEG